MALWLLLILVLNLQGYCLGVQKNETRISGHAEIQLKSTETSPPTVLRAVSGELRSPQDAGADQVISTTSKYSISTSNPHNGIKNFTTTSQTTTKPILKTITTSISSRIKPTFKEAAPLSEFPVQKEAKTKSSLSDPVTSSTTLSSSQKPHVLITVHHVIEETSSDSDNYETRLPRKTTFPKTNGTKAIHVHTNRSENHSSSEETLGQPAASTSTATESATELATLTPVETSTEEETSTIMSTETADWSYSETDETTTENSSENNFSYTSTDISTDPTTTDLANDTEYPTTEGPSIPNVIASHENQPIRGVSSPLTKLILRLSKPGVFEKGKSVFEDDSSAMTTSCPPGDVGLSCRRLEARKGADECSGGNCEVCRSCSNMAAIDWPHCCRENFRCCSELALACQQCDQPTLQVFCTKHFKRCF